jgi:hypothetical protein
VTPARLRALGFAALGTAGCIAAPAAPPAPAPRVRMSLEPTVVGVGQVATLSIEVTDGGMGEPGFAQQFELDNFEALGGPSSYEEVNFVNGRISRSRRLAWTLRAQGPGTAVVRDVRLKLADGRIMRLPDQQVRVDENAVPPPPRDPAEAAMPDPDELLRRFMGGEPRTPRGLARPWGEPAPDDSRRPALFLRGEVEPQSPYVGQQVTYRLALYQRIKVDAVNLGHLPIFRGFWVRDFPSTRYPPQEQVDVDGVPYNRMVLLKKALFPRRAGRYPLEPASIDLVVSRAEGTFFGTAILRPQQVTLETDPMFVDVRPLPPAPDGWSGAVGRLAMVASVEPRRIKVGENVQIRVTLSGSGNLQGIPSPALPAVPGLSFYPPEQSGDDKVVGEQVNGRRTWTFVAVPEQPGHFSIPLPSVAYFDPDRGTYRTATAPAAAIDVHPRLPPSPAAAAPALAAAGVAAPRKLPWVAVLVFLATLPWGIALLIYARRRAGRGVDPVLRADLRRELDGVRAEERPRQAAARLEEVVGSWVAERCNRPGPLPSSHWRDELVACGAHPEAADEAARLADEINYLRHAPQLSATEGLRREAVDRALDLAGRLRR